MTMDYKDTLLRFTLAAKSIIYNAPRAEQLLKMMSTVGGVISAVHAVIAGISKKKPVPPEIAPLLGVSILMLLVDLGEQVSGKKPPAKLMSKVVKKLMTDVYEAHPVVPAAPLPQVAQPLAPARRPGLINQGA